MLGLVHEKGLFLPSIKTTILHRTVSSCSLADIYRHTNGTETCFTKSIICGEE